MLTEMSSSSQDPMVSFTTVPDYHMMDTTDFQYMEQSDLSDPYCDLTQPAPTPSPPKETSSSPSSSSSSSNCSSSNSFLLSLLHSQPPSSCSSSSVAGDVSPTNSVAIDQFQQPFLDSASHYENDLVSLDRVTPYDDINKYSDISDLKYDDDLKYEDMIPETGPSSCCSSSDQIMMTPSGGELSGAEYSPVHQAGNEGLPNYEGDEECSPGAPDNGGEASKGKVTDLQRTALDAIFKITDRPGRGLVLYIATELHLHHVTVKNFFSNARRRVRRAAARLSDPERSRRENKRRKEKRRLAALAAAAAADGQVVGDTSTNLPLSSGLKILQNDAPAKEPVTLSPERRALMEKLADKVQRSAAQKNLSAMPAENTSSSNTRVAVQPRHQIPPPQTSTASSIVTASTIPPPSIAPTTLDFTTPSISSVAPNLVPDVHVPPAPTCQVDFITDPSSSCPLDFPSAAPSCTVDLNNWPQSLLSDTLVSYPSDAVWDMPQLY